MSQKIKEFVKRSGIEVQTPNSASTTASNNSFARNLEIEMLKKQGYQNNNNSNYGNFKQFINNTPSPTLDNEFNDVFNKMIENKNIQNLLAPPTELMMSKLIPGMFNATVNTDFGKTPILDLTKILTKKPIGKVPIGDGLYIDTLEIKGLYGQFKTGFSHTRVHGPKGDLNKNFFSAQLMLNVSNDIESKGATVNFYKNGKIRFSGGFIGENIVRQPELIRKYIVDTYTERQSFLYNPFEYNNLSGQFRINGVFKNLGSIASQYRKYGMTEVSYEPEITPFLYAYFGDTKFILTTSGNIQISGAKSPVDLVNSYEMGKRFIQRLNADNHIIVTGQFADGPSKPVKKTKVKAKTNTTFTNKNINALKIAGKKCERMKKPELMNFARKMGVVDFRTKVKNGTRASTKKEICDRIRGKTVVPKINNKSMTGKNKTFRIGKIICTNLKKDELIRMATILKIPLSDKETKISLCKKIEMKRNNLSVSKPPPPPKLKKAAVLNTKRANVMKKRGLDDNSIRKDIAKLYGERWMKRYKL